MLADAVVPCRKSRTNTSDRVGVDEISLSTLGDRMRGRAGGSAMLGKHVETVGGVRLYADISLEEFVSQVEDILDSWEPRSCAESRPTGQDRRVAT